jgi:predicted ester cyclase
MSTAENISLAKRWYHEVWNEGKNETIHELLAPDAVLIGTDYVAIKGPEHQFVVDDIFGYDDKVAIRWHATMKHSGEMQGIPATGNAVKITGTSIAQFKNGKVVAGWDNWDRFAMLNQIGAFTADLAKTA